MANYHTPYAAGVTQFTATSMNPALVGLDRAITYHKGALVGCDGLLTWATGTLTWSDSLHIYFNRTDGQAIHNEIAAGSISLSDGEFCYVTLSETNNATVTMSKAAITTGVASNFLAYNILLMGYRNTDDDNFYPEELAGVFARNLTSGDLVEKATFNANTILKADTDNTPVALTVGEQTLVGRITGGSIAALTPAQVVTLLGSLSMAAGQQSITCADSTTVDWSAGSTAYMTFDRDSVALTLSNGVAGQVYRFLVKQSSGGSDVFTYATTIKWRGGSAPTLTTAGNSVDIFTFVYINSVWYGDCALNFA